MGQFAIAYHPLDSEKPQIQRRLCCDQLKKTNQQVVKTLRPTEIHTRINKKVNLENESHKVILVISIKAKSKISNYPEKNRLC